MGRPKASKNGGKETQLLQQMKEAATLLKHVSDPTRLRIILMLQDREMYVGELCHELDMSQAAVSHHLILLRYGGVVHTRRQGQRSFYSLTEKGELLAGVIKKITG